VGQALGLGDSEAAIYVHLCLTGPAKAGDLAGALKIHRNEVYRSASRLVSRGLAEITLERPSRFSAVSPETVFETEIAARLTAVTELKSARDRVSPLLSHAQAHLDAAPRTTYKVVQGRAEIYAVRDRLVESARASIDWATTFPPSVPLADISGGLDLMLKRAKEGVALRAILRTSPATLPRVERFRGLAQLREAPLDRTVRFVIVDGTSLLMWVVNDPSESLHAREEVAIHTTAAGFVQAEALFFDQMWAKAAPLLGA
jgi:sugar-specific transcriptional regulator TrmB